MGILGYGLQSKQLENLYLFRTRSGKIQACINIQFSEFILEECCSVLLTYVEFCCVLELPPSDPLS